MGINKIFQYGRFCAKMSVRARPIFTLGPPPIPNKWLIPLNHYIFRKYILWPCSSFLNFSKIFYSKKAFFIPPEECQIVKMLNLDPRLAPPTLGGGTWSPHFCDQGPWVCPPYKFGSDPRHCCSCPAVVRVTHGMRLKRKKPANYELSYKSVWFSHMTRYS